MDTRNVIARFEAERQALALMDHPDIARVFDAGATDAGRPFFVMEFVDGVPITRFCDEHSLSMPARLELFARVCVALQHAHQKGIIHRDLKPSNILVALRDGTPAPKVIDFGIAKATQGRLTEHTLVTGIEQFIGTPAYMSPEQAELRDLDIDTRSDVYSLGVLLYELLTGRPPYDPQSLVRAGIEEIRRIIREVEPPRPSTRISTLADADRATVARLRGSAPMQLTSVLRGDLDWIVMRCLEKDRDRRYGTAHELADDVRRHLRQEPVAARPPHALYRTQKFIARNRLVCASAAAVALALIVGTIVSVRQAVRATRAERVAQAQRLEAQAQREQAETLLTFILGDYRADVKKLGKLDLLDAVNDRVMKYFAAFDLRPLSDSALTQQAKALTQVGETRIEQARFADAHAAFDGAYQRAAALAARHPRNGDMLFERAQAEFWLGVVARRRGDFTTAREWLVRYRDSGATLVALEGKTLRAQREQIAGQHNLAVLDVDRGNLAAAQTGLLAERVSIEEMLSLHPPTPQLRFRLADVESWLGTVAEHDGRYPDAIGHYTTVVERIGAVIAAEPQTAHWKLRQADARLLLSHALLLTGRLDEAVAPRATARTALEALVAQDPKNRLWQSVLLRLRLHEIAARVARREAAAVAGELTEIRSQLAALVAAEPTSLEFNRQLATAWRLEALIRRLLNRPDAAEAAANAVALGEKLVRDDKANRRTLWEFAHACLTAGRIAAPDASAQAHWVQALDAVRPALADSRDWRLLDPAAQALSLLGRSAEAQPLIDQLRRSGYRSLDPFAGSILDLASTQVSPPPNE